MSSRPPARFTGSSPRPRGTGSLRIGFAGLIVAGFLFPTNAPGLLLLEAPETLEPPPFPGAAEAIRWVGELQHGATPGFLATVIGPRHFLTAAHIDFSAGERFFLAGQPYVITGRTNLPGTDLAVGFVEGTFPGAVPLLERQDEPGRAALVIGKGRWKGEPVIANGSLKGWRYAESGVPGIRWGTNTVERIVTVSHPAPGEPAGAFLAASFNRDGGAHEVHLTRGDSGAPVFLEDCGTWKLAGIASTVDGPFATMADPAAEDFAAALFDIGGLYRVPGDGQREFVPDDEADVPSGWYAVRVSASIDVLRGVMGLPARQEVAPPADGFVWLAGDSTPVKLEGVLDPTDVAGLVCVDAHTRLGVPVAWDGGTHVTAGSGVAAGVVDRLGFVVERSGGRRALGNLYLLRSIPSLKGPGVFFGCDGRAVILWPGADGAVAAESAEDVTGPWKPVPGRLSRLEPYAAFADPTAWGARRFYRIRW